MSTSQKSLIEGSIPRSLVQFGIPVLISNVVQSLYSAADLYIISRFNGAESIAGVSIGAQITILMTSFASGLVTGGSVLLAQYIGAKRSEDAARTIGTLATTMLVLALAINVVMLLCGDLFLHLIRAPVEAYSEAKSYLTVCMCGTIFVFGYSVTNAILRSMGDSTKPLVFTCIACVANVALDYIVVGLWGWKAFGAALTTVISQGASLCVALFYLFRKRDLLVRLKRSDFLIHKGKFKQILHLGIPASIQNTMTSFAFFTIAALVNAYGVGASAGVSVASRIYSFAIIPTSAMATAVTTIAGQNIGAGFYDRAKRTWLNGIQISLSVGIIVCLLLQTFPERFIRIFTDDPDAIPYGIAYLRASSLDLLIVPFYYCCSGFVTASGYTLIVSCVSIFSSLIARMPIAYFLGHYYGLDLFGIGLALPLGSLVAFMLHYAFIRSGRWMKSRLIDRE